MYRGQTIGVVVPAYNEADFVGSVIRSLPEFVDRTYVIDDCSTDATWQAIQATSTAINETREDTETDRVETDGGQVFDNPIQPIRHDRNRGVGGAIKTGYRRALEDGIDVVAVISGDGQMDPDILDEFLDPIVTGAVDFTKGDRLTPEFRSGMPPWRRFGSYLLTRLTRIASGYWEMSDSQNGYTAISREALEAIDLDRLYEGYGFINDLLIQLNVHDLRIADVEMEPRYGDETSHIRYSEFVPKLSWLLLRRTVWRYRTKYTLGSLHPCIVFPLVGVLGSILGVGVSAWSLVEAEPGTVFGSVSTLLLALGACCWLLTLVADRYVNRDLQATLSDTLDVSSD